MINSPRSEAHVAATWCHLLDTVDTVCGELRSASPETWQKALAVVARALREPPSRQRIPIASAIIGELRNAATGVDRR